MRVIFLLIFILLFQTLYSQQGKDSTYRIPFDTNRIQSGVRLSEISGITNYRDYFIWNDKRNLAEILNEKAGYFVNTLGFGQRNVINFNGYTEKQIGIFRDGIQLNDNFFGGFDIENISVNEIDRVEEVSNISSFIYGMNTYGKSINVISKDVFQSKPFSQLRYSQDRSGSLFADAFFMLPISKKVSVQVGANNYSLDGRYENTSLSLWRARARVNYFPSSKFNIKLNFYHNKLKRSLNEGLQYNAEESALLDDDAPVVNPDSYEKLKNFYYDVTVTGRLFREKSSLTKLKLYSMNSIREYRDEELQRLNPNGRFVTNNFHSIQYAADFKQNIFFRPSRNVIADITAGGNFYYNRYNFTNIYPGADSTNVGNDVTAFNNNYYSLIAKADITISNVTVSGSFKTDFIEGESYSNYGVESVVKLLSNTDYSLSVNGGIRQTNAGINYNSNLFYSPVSVLYSNETNRYIEAGASFRYKGFGVSVLQYDNGSDNPFEHGNYSLNYTSRYVDGYLNVNKSSGIYFPDWFVKADLSYHNLFFKNKLNLRAGVNVKYFHELAPVSYSQYLYMPGVVQGTLLENKIYLDLYLGATIGSANINLTVANIFNTLFYDTFVYPYDDRGGALNAVSRFTIVWDFLD